MSKPLCRTCAHAMYVRGRSLSHMRLFCDALLSEPELFFEAHECSQYQQRGTVALSNMEDIAWTIARDSRQGFLGFIPPRKEKQ